jgi:hypothetical protein
MNINDITSGPATSPSDLIDLEESLAVQEVNQPPPLWAFRGQPKGFETLVPSFQRIFTSKKSVGTAHIIERDLVDAFRTHYAELPGRAPGMPVPTQIADGFDLRCLSVMQHYGVPTRLLDWTSEFWTAVYFACAGDPSQDAELWFYDRRIFLENLAKQPELETLTVWNPPYPQLPPQEPQLLSQRGGHLIVELDVQLTPRMREQRAHHTFSTDVFADHALLILELAQAAGAPTSFRRVVISSGCKEKALRFLDEYKHVKASSLFPDVEGLGKFLRWHLDTLVTTLL